MPFASTVPRLPVLEPKLRGVPLLPKVMSLFATRRPPASLKTSLPAIAMLSNVATAPSFTTIESVSFVVPARFLPVTVEFSATTNGYPFGCWGIVQSCVNVRSPERTRLGPARALSEASG